MKKSIIRRRYIIRPVWEEIRKTVPVYEKILVRNLLFIIRRHTHDPDYPFIDTKIDIRTGMPLSRQYGETDLFGKETIYGWIQGRGLEALAAHHDWLETRHRLSHDERRWLRTNCREIIAKTSRVLLRFYRRNNGRIFFWMDRAGNAFVIKNGRKTIVRPDTNSVSYSDLFAAKGFLRAGTTLKDHEMIESSLAYTAMGHT